MFVWYKLAIAVILCVVVGSIAGLFTASSINTWYSGLNKPSFNPPNYLFGPVWTILYIMMGVALYFLWQNTTSSNKIVIIFFIIQLILNFFWSFIFFQLKSPLFAFIEILILLVMILLTIIYSYPVSKTAAYLMVPYLMWVMFATVLNFSIYSLNR